MNFVAILASWFVGLNLATIWEEPSIEEQQSDWTVGDVDALKNIMYSFFGEPHQEKRAPGALRLAFHDCVDLCDGCVDLNHPGYFGLEKILTDIEYLYISTVLIKYMSRADFYNLAGIAAVEYSIEFNNDNCANPPDCLMSQINIEFLLGRTDCPTSPFTAAEHQFPRAHFDHQEMMQFWWDRFGMTPRDVTAIMGGHTLGGMHRQISGYVGDWKMPGNESLSFNNNYYSLLLDPNLTWEHFDASKRNGQSESLDSSEQQRREKWQWRGVDQEGRVGSYMTDVDVELLLDLDIIDEGGQSTCGFDNCPFAETKRFVELYASDSDAWLRDFACAYERMTSVGMENLRRPLGRAVSDAEGIVSCPKCNCNSCQ